MPDLSPGATVLINKYTPSEIAERLVKQEELSANLEYDNAKNLAMATEEQQLRHKAEANVDKWKTEANRLYGVGQDIEELRVKLESENTAQAQTIKAAHIRTAEISTRYNDCQRQVDGWQALCIFEEKSSLHLLKLIADDLVKGKLHEDVKRARANWLRRFIKAAANLEGGDDE